MQETRLASIKDEKEFTNILAVREYVDDLVKYCFGMYDSFSRTVQEDEARNEPLKFELREYKFHKSFSSDCSVHIFPGGTDYKSYGEFVLALNGGNIQGIGELTLRLDLSFRRGSNNQLEEHNHKFTIKMSPELTKFSYEANYDDPTMNDIRDKLIAKLEAFPATTTIFSRAN